MKYYVRIENTEEELLFEGWIDNVPSLEELKTAIENKFMFVLGHYWVATKKWTNYHDACIIFNN